MKKPFLYTLITVGIVVLANLLIWPYCVKVTEHKQMPPVFSKKVRFRTYMERYRPQIVFLGNSTLRDGVEPIQFSQLVGKRTINFVQDGGASAWWYLTFKNVVLKSSYKPQIVGIFMRDNDMTNPSFRVDGMYRRWIDDMADEDEPLLDRLAFLGNMDFFTYFLYRCFPLYQKKAEIRDRLDSAVKNKVVVGLTKDDVGEADKAIDRIFADENMNKALLTIRQLAAEKTGTKESFDFDKVVGNSFLPHIIDMAKDSGIKLIFVRLKKRRDVVPNSEPEELKEYIKYFSDYLADRNVTFWDFTYEKRIEERHFHVGDHLEYLKTGEGRALFTQLLAQKFIPIIQKLPEQ